MTIESIQDAIRDTMKEFEFYEEGETDEEFINALGERLLRELGPEEEE